MKIKKEVIGQLAAHAKKEAPIEACGYLTARYGIITSAYKLTNIDRSSGHFSFEPKEQFEALKDARARGLEIRAVYHSHPASPARPSEEDIKLAYDPQMLYVIISLEEGREDVKAFEIKNGKVTPVKLEIIEDEGI